MLQFSQKLKNFQKIKHSQAFCTIGQYNDPLNIHISDPTIRHYGDLQDAFVEIKNLHIPKTPIEQYIQSYRKYGHLYAKFDPLNQMKRVDQFVNPLDFGLSYQKKPDPLENNSSYLLDNSNSLEELETQLQNTYLQSVGVEFDHIQSTEEKKWLYNNFEKYQSQTLTKSEKKNILTLLVQSEAFDHYLHQKFQTFKRYGGEGLESSISGLRALFAKASELGVEECVLGMPHRGRLNVLTNLLDYPPEHIIRKIKGYNDMPKEFTSAIDDVISHIAVTKKKKFIGAGCKEQPISVSMMHNPSHLELINPASLGKTRAKQDDHQKKSKVLNVQLHGDAAFAAQGVVYENFAISQVPKFEIGGSIHLICNNQIGYTTSVKDSRGHFYCSDIGKMYQIPILHINADDPEAVQQMFKFAVDYRQQFQKDIIIDLIGYRKYGHNELDEPMFTQPLYYKQIQKKQLSCPQLYLQKLVEEDVVQQEFYEDLRGKIFGKLEQVFQNTRTEHNRPLEEYISENPKGQSAFNNKWKNMTFSNLGKDDKEIPTGLKQQYLKNLGKQSVTVPADFKIHPRLNKYFIQDRIKQIENDSIDWATAEAIAIGSLLQQSYNVRFSGEDVERGTFSQRHWVLVDQETEQEWNPLKDISEGMNKGNLQVCNSPLSESGVLSYEYGYSLESPNNLSMWEAQFGDFFNCAQTTFDTLIISSEEKWAKQTGLVVILPHGFDGAGPEHSSCKIERFLQQANTDSLVREFEYKQRNPQRGPEQISDNFFYENPQDSNFSFVQPTTPANYYHLLRRQMLRNYRKPLIIAGPKTLLRHPKCKSSFKDMDENTYFKPVLQDFDLNQNTENIILCSGKIKFNLIEQLQQNDIKNTTILTIEELYPFPVEQIQDILSNQDINKQKVQFLWVQEEPSNQGAYSFVEPHFARILKDLQFENNMIQYVGRRSIASTAIGAPLLHKQETNDVFQQLFTKLK